MPICQKVTDGEASVPLGGEPERTQKCPVGWGFFRSPGRLGWACSNYGSTEGKPPKMEDSLAPP